MATEGQTQRAVVLFGPPGSGKGTQAKLLRECLNFPHISTGDMLRDHIQAGDEIGQRVNALMRAGMLVPDELVNDLVYARTSRPDCELGFILDGYPRTIPQAQVMEGLFAERGTTQVVVYLKVDYNKVIARLTGRRQCPVCGTLYSLTSLTPKIPEICDKDGATLVVREDDRESVIRQRLEAYEEQTAPVLGYFRQSGHPFYEVDGSDDPPKVILAKICALIQNG